jgi:hypothetical protein
MTLTPSRVALGLAGLAVALQLGLTRTWRQEAAALAEQHQRALNQQRTERRRLAELEARAELRAQAAALVGRSAATAASDAAVQKVRMGIVEALDAGLPSSRLEVRRGPAPAVATVTLSTAGDFATVVELASTLAQPRSGLVFRRLSFSRSGNGTLGINVEASALGGVS